MKLLSFVEDESSYFDRDDVALRHFAEFFKEQSHEEREHAEKLMAFQNKRGGRVLLQDVKKPEQDEWGNGLEAMQRALQMEKDVNQSLLDLHKLSSGHTDPHTLSYSFNFFKTEAKNLAATTQEEDLLGKLGFGSMWGVKSVENSC
ncbi:ferritin, higher subunit-like [Chiloscyllium punctatum]|uniref:ferritin, higher subunit-like n=1 Tax=Chiloscyllium punctatum TaxID=137246 RepID=UPI003B63802B